MTKTKKGKRCPKCKGTGNEVNLLPGQITIEHMLGIPSFNYKRCSICQGTGFLRRE